MKRAAASVGRSVLRLRPRAEPARDAQEEPELREERGPQLQAATGAPSQIDIRTAVNLDASYEAVKANEADYTYQPADAASAEELEEEFGLKGRFRVRPTNCISYIAMNSGGTGAGAALFRNNPQLRRAVNYVIDRKAMVELSGEYTMLPHDQYLPRGSRASRTSTRTRSGRMSPRLASLPPVTSRAVVRGSTTTASQPPGPQRMELVRAQLRTDRDPDRAAGFPRLLLGYDPAGKRNSPHAFAAGRLVPGLLGSVRLHQRPSLRRRHPGGEQHQHRLLQRPASTTGGWSARRG